MNTRKGLFGFFDSAVWLIRKNILGIIIFINIMLLPCFIQPCYAGWPYLTNRQYIEDSWTRGSRNAHTKFDFHDGKIYSWNRNYGKYKFIEGDILEFWVSKKSKGLYLLERKDLDTMLWWRARVNGEKIGSAARFTWYRVNEKEWLKAEAERKKAEAEQERLERERLKIEAEARFANVVQRDGVYVAYADGVVRDTSTGLEWMVGLNRNTTRIEAKQWVEDLNIDGGVWRMPTMDELAGLYRKGAGYRNMTPLLKNTGWYVWAGDSKDPFDFNAGGISTNDALGFLRWQFDHEGDNRAFAVRSR